MENKVLVKEIEESGEIRAKVKARLSELEQLVTPVPEPPASPVPTAESPLIVHSPVHANNDSFLGPTQQSVKVNCPNSVSRSFLAKFMSGKNSGTPSKIPSTRTRRYPTWINFRICEAW